jgi:hypothetical protein
LSPHYREIQLSSINAPEGALEWGNRLNDAKSKYWPLAVSGVLFSMAFVSDICWAAALADEDATQWIWGLGSMASLGFFISSLTKDHFKVLHYLADHAGIHLQYSIAAGPLEKIKVTQRTLAWSGIRSADYSVIDEEDGSETRTGVELTLNTPLGSGRNTVSLQADHPSHLMSLVTMHLDRVRHAPQKKGSTIAIA